MFPGGRAREHGVYQDRASWLRLSCELFVQVPGKMELMVQSCSANPGWFPLPSCLCLWEPTLLSVSEGWDVHILLAVRGTPQGCQVVL